MYKKYKLHRKDNFKAQNPEMDLMKCISTTITSATKQQLTARGHIFHWSVRFTADFRDRKACLVEPAGRGFAAVLREREMTGKEQKEKINPCVTLVQSINYLRCHVVRLQNPKTLNVVTKRTPK